MRPMRPVRPLDLAPDSPVTLMSNGIAVALDKPFAAFEGAFRTLFRPRTLSAWAVSDLGRHRMAERGVHPGELDRFTVYGYGSSSGRVSRCTELYIIKPREHLPLIVEAAEEAARA